MAQYNRTDWSWIATVGNQLAGVITQIPSAVKYTQALKENRIKTGDIYSAIESNVKAMPKEAIDVLGTTKTDIINARPKPEKNEDPRTYSARVVAWYKPIVQRLVDAGIPADTIQTWGAATTEGAGALADERVAESLSASRKSQQAQARTGEIERRAEQAMQPEMQSMAPTAEAMGPGAAGPVRPGEAPPTQPSPAASMGITRPQMQPSYAVPGTAAKSTSDMLASTRFSEPVGGRQATAEEIKGTRAYQAMSGREKAQQQATKNDLEEQRIAAAYRKYQAGQQLSQDEIYTIRDRLDDNYRSLSNKYYDMAKSVRAATEAKKGLDKARADLATAEAAAQAGTGTGKQVEAARDRVAKLEAAARSGYDEEDLQRVKSEMDDSKRELDAFRKKHNMLPKDTEPSGTRSGGSYQVGGYQVSEE